jgi:L-ornithine N5-monooxygenase
MDREEVELLAVGAGPANLALAVALEELAPTELAADSLIIEQHRDVMWQRGMLLPWTQSQVSFLKDLVTLRNPRSRFSFINYLHSIGRLNAFINLGSFTPYRIEISGYLRWIAESLTTVRIQYGRRCTRIVPGYDSADEVTHWVVRVDDGSELACRNLVIGAGRDPWIPEVFASLPPQRVIHSTEFATEVAKLDPTEPYRIVVIGGAQSAAEMLWASHQTFPRARCTMIMRSIGLNNYESSKFTNELFYPSFVDKFYAALPEARDQLLREMHRTNYSGLAPSMLDSLYRQMYLENLAGTERLHMITMTEVRGARMRGDQVELTLLDRRSGETTTLDCDVVLLGTGFAKTMPKVVRELAASVGVDRIEVTRSYRMNLPTSVRAACYLQGVNEATHGIADSLLSLLAVRAEEMVFDLLSRQRPRELAAVQTPSFGGARDDGDPQARPRRLQA